MNITAKQIERSNVVFTFRDSVLPLPEPAQVFAAYDSEATRGSLFSDHVASASRVFELPSLGLQWIFEPGRVRLEDKKYRVPTESKLPQELLRVVKILYPTLTPLAYGFNYDILYRMSNVIPVADVMSNFLDPVTREQVKHFGWQYTLEKEKGRFLETYFFKAVSPIEFSVHANFHFNDPGIPQVEDMQAAFEKKYLETDSSVLHIVFA